MKGKRIEKWKNKGISEFIMKVCLNQQARNPGENIKIPKEAIPIILGTELDSEKNIDSLTILGSKVEIY